MIEIARHFSPSASIVATSTAGTTSTAFPYGRFSGGAILIAATNGCTQIQWHGAASPNVTPSPIYADGAAVTTAVTAGVHPIPDACFGVHYLAPVMVGGTTCAMTVMVKG
jgi:hypothetical protein